MQHETFADNCSSNLEYVHPGEDTLPKEIPVCLSFLFVSHVVDCVCWTVAAQCAPMDTHGIATKPSLQLMVLRHGALSGFCPIIILMKRLNAFVVG